MTSRYYCFTAWKEPIFVPQIMRYMCYGIETCDKTGRIHWQSYVELKKSIRFAGLKFIMKDNTIHYDERMGSREQARDYCIGPWVSSDGKRSKPYNMLHKVFGQWERRKVKEVSITLQSTGCYMCDTLVYYMRIANPNYEIKRLCENPFHISYRNSDISLSAPDFCPMETFFDPLQFGN